jgi:hypothetical protein
MSNMVQDAYWYVLSLKASLRSFAHFMGLAEYLI